MHPHMPPHIALQVTWTPDGAWTEAVVAELEGQYKEEQREALQPSIQHNLTCSLNVRALI